MMQGGFGTKHGRMFRQKFPKCFHASAVASRRAMGVCDEDPPKINLRCS
jgi:hypothetical protein